MWQCLYWLFLALLSAKALLADPLYRWQDTQGNIHYSDHPPSGDAKVLHPDIGHEPTPEELEAIKAKRLEKEKAVEERKKEAQQKQETANRPLVIIPVPIIQRVPEVYTPYWGPIYPYRRQPVDPRSKPWHTHPRRKTNNPPARRTPSQGAKKPMAPSERR